MSLKDEAEQELEAGGTRQHEEPTETIHHVQNNRAAIEQLQRWVVRLAAEIDELKSR